MMKSDKKDNVNLHRQPHKVYFKLGKLRYGFHGILGVMCLALSVCATFNPSKSILVIVATVLNEILVVDAYSLLDQVPRSTVIWKPDLIVAPHKEAFKRTIAIFHYSGLRIGSLLLEQNESATNALSTITMLPPRHLLQPFLLMAWTLFLPLGSNFKNGNTWIFVIPMFLGVSLDMMFPDCLEIQHLVIVQLSALLLAFMFTLAFRGIANIVHIYFVSAAVVAALMAYGCAMLAKTVIWGEQQNVWRMMRV